MLLNGIIQQSPKFRCIGRTGDNPGVHSLRRLPLVPLAKVNYKLKSRVTHLEEVGLTSDQLTFVFGLLRVAHFDGGPLAQFGTSRRKQTGRQSIEWPVRTGKHLLKNVLRLVRPVAIHLAQERLYQRSVQLRA
jgi:hypothetical protein